MNFHRLLNWCFSQKQNWRCSCRKVKPSRHSGGGCLAAGGTHWRLGLEEDDLWEHIWCMQLFLSHGFAEADASFFFHDKYYDYLKKQQHLFHDGLCALQRERKKGLIYF